MGTRRRRFSRQAVRERTRAIEFEPLEDRRLLAAAFLEREVLVQFAPTATAAAKTAARTAVRGRAVEVIQTTAMRSQGLGSLERVSLGQGISVAQAVSLLAKRPGVVFAEPNWKLTTSAVSNDPSYSTGSQLWGMYGDDQPAAVGPAGTTNQFGSQAEKAWDAGFTGSRDVFVGIVDEGVDFNHPDLAANVWSNPFEVAGDGLDNDGNGYVDDVRGWDFYANDASVYDGSGDDHGTHVAGTVGGVGGNGIGVAGVSWNVSLIPTKFLGTDGGTTTAAIKALDYLTDLKARHGINIVASNNSWGGGGYSSALHSAIIRGANAGILFVAAAGNSGVDTDATANYPSNYSTLQGTSTTRAATYEAVISVAALTSSGGLASFSNFGATTVDLAAPGAGIVSTLPGGGYGSYSGTSMAAPHVTGVVALLAAARPGTTPADIRSAILSTARGTGSLAGRTVTGGRLDAAAALTVEPPTQIAITGGSVVEGNSGTTSLVFTVTLSAAAASPVSVTYATVNGTATAGTDYAVASGTLSFAPGEITKTILVSVTGDTTYEANETLSVSLSAPSGNSRIATASATGTITNDDPQPPPPTTPSLAIASVAALEGEGRLTFTVTLSAAASSRITVRYATTNGTAKAGRTGDYSSTSGTLTFNAGETSKTIPVSVLNESLVEPDETFFVDLSRPSGATIAVSRGTGTIRNDDGLTAAAFAAFAAADQAPSATKRR